MNIDNLKAVGKLKAHRGLLITRKYSPEILTATGIIGGVTAAIMGAKATLKLEPLISDLETRKEIVHAKTVAKEYDDKERKTALAYVYTRSAIDFTKLYGPSVSLGVASIGCIVGAHGIMQRRNVALVAAVSATEKTFAEYRKRVETALGTDKEFELRHGATSEEIPADDKTSTEAKTIMHMDPNSVSGYAKFFDEMNQNWSDEPEYNRMFLRTQQQFSNDLLHSRGHLFLNEVYDMIGVPRTKQGQIVGWVLSKDGDNFVDFGFLRGESERVREFINGNEPSILLDFNVDGVIFDKIG